MHDGRLKARSCSSTGRLICKMLNKDVSRRKGERLSVRISVPKTALGALLSLPFVAVCGVLLTASLTNLTDESVGRSAFKWLMVALGSSIQLIVGLAGAAFFGYALVFFSIRLLLFWRPRLRWALKVCWTGPPPLVRASCPGR